MPNDAERVSLRNSFRVVELHRSDDPYYPYQFQFHTLRSTGTISNMVIAQVLMSLLQQDQDWGPPDAFFDGSKNRRWAINGNLIGFRNIDDAMVFKLTYL